MTGDPLKRVNTDVVGEMFRKTAGQGTEPPGSVAGRAPPYDAVMMKRILLFRLYGQSDEQAEFRSWTGAPLSGSLVFWMPATESTRVAGQLKHRRRRQADAEEYRARQPDMPPNRCPCRASFRRQKDRMGLFIPPSAGRARGKSKSAWAISPTI